MSRLSVPLPMAWLAVLAVPLAAGACASSDDPTPEPEPTETPQLVSLGLETADDLSVEMLSRAGLEVGLNEVFFRVKRLPGGELVERATVLQRPIMHMEAMGMEHSCPCEQPALEVDEDGLFSGLVVFQMASGTGGDTWRNEVSVDLGDGAAPRTVVFEGLAVAASDRRKDLTLTDAMGGTTAAVVTLNFDGPLAAGQNTFTVTVHQKGDMMGMVWDAIEDLTITATPDMPSMGHGSSGNIDPVHVAAGRYEGSVNLFMPGTWRIILGFEKGQADLGTIEYVVEVE